MFKQIYILSSAALLASLLLLAPAAPGQTTWYVDDDAPNDPGPGDPSVSDPNEDGSAAHPFDAIQEGIDAAIAGDTVLVLDGTYTGTGNKNLDFGGIDMTVRSENGPVSCIIDCQGSGCGFFIQNGETSAAVVDGFTITGGNRTYGGGVNCTNGSDPTIKNCIITASHAGMGGGGVNCGINTGPTLVNCIIAGNTSDAEGGGVRGNESTATLVHCTIADNDGANDGWGKGGGVYLEGSIDVVMANCVLSGNTASLGPEGSLVDSSTLTISYSDVHGGQAEVHVEGGCTLNWGDGMMDADPLFVDPNNSDYHLGYASPCVDAGTNDPPGGLPTTDFEGDVRPLDGDGDVEPWTGQAETADIGADEIEAPTTPDICMSPSAFTFVGPEGGPDPNDQTLSIWNCAAGTLNWQIVESCSWLSADPNSGSSIGEIDDVALSVSVAGLSPGVYDCTLDVVDPNAANSPQTVNVTLRVCCPDGMTLYVDDDASLGGDGTSWNTAFTYLQDALYALPANPCTAEIRVAGGTYYPDEDEAGNVTPGDRVETFQLLDGVTVAGGYRGLAGGGDPNDSDIDTFETVLSGSIPGHNSQHVVTGSGTDATAVLNGVSIAYGVACEAGPFYGGAGVYIVDGSPTLRNCTVRHNSTAIWSPEHPEPGGDGAGLYCYGGSPTLVDCVVRDNHTVIGEPAECYSWSAIRGGDAAGLFFENASPVLIGCSIMDNIAGGGGGGGVCDDGGYAGARGGQGGGVYLVDCPDALFVDCLLSGNSTGNGGTGGESTYGRAGGDAGAGGGVCLLSSDARFFNCSIAENTCGNGGRGGGAWFGEGGNGGAGGHGSGVYLSGGQADFVNCLIANNTAGDGHQGGEGNEGEPDGSGGDAGSGAGVYVYSSTATFANCTIVQNIAGLPGTGDPNGAEGYGGIAQGTGGTATIANCVFWGSTGAGTTEEQQLHGGTITIDYSCVEGWTGSMGGAGNIGDDPSFSDPNTADYHLSAGSPCIDAADNTAVPADEGDLDNDSDTAERTPLDLRYLPRFVDDPNTADTGVADPPDYPNVVDMGAYEFGIACDLDGDCDVDIGDLAQLLSNYGTTTGMGYEDGDVDNDGDVELPDLAALLAEYGASCP